MNRSVFRLRLKELRDGTDLILRGIKFQIAAVANRKALRPIRKKLCINHVMKVFRL